MKLKRSHLLLINLITIILFFGINRFNYLLKAEFSEGIVIGEKEWTNKGYITDNDEADSNKEDKEIAPVIEFTTKDNEEIIFTAQRNLKYSPGDRLKVIYKPNIPGKAKVYSFFGFWFEPIIISIIPLMIFSALILSFISKNDIIYFSNKEIKRIKKNKSIDKHK